MARTMKCTAIDNKDLRRASRNAIIDLRKNVPKFTNRKLRTIRTLRYEKQVPGYYYNIDNVSCFIADKDSVKNIDKGKKYINVIPINY